MATSAQQLSHEEAGSNAFASNSRVAWIGSKMIQSLGIEADRLEGLHQQMMLHVLQNKGAAAMPASGESDRLAAQIVAVARAADKAAVIGGSNAALVAVMRESGRSLDPLLAQNFLRLASSPIFWMALESVGEAQTQGSH